MHNPIPGTQPVWTTEELVNALHQMRDAWMRTALELRDIQFGMNTTQRQDAIDRANDLVHKIKSR
jgi:hypothetical protein